MKQNDDNIIDLSERRRADPNRGLGADQAAGLGAAATGGGDPSRALHGAGAARPGAGCREAYLIDPETRLVSSVMYDGKLERSTG